MATLAAAVLPPTLVLWLLPLQVYFANPAYGNATPEATLRGLTPLWLVAIGLVAIVASTIPRRWRPAVVATGLALAWAVVLVGQVLAPRADLLLDGRPLDLAVTPTTRLVDLGALVLAALLGAGAVRAGAAWAGLLGTLALGWSLVCAAVPAWQHRAVVRAQSGSFPADVALTLSSQANIVHVMLDSLQGDVLNAVLAEDESLAGALAGAEVFVDHAGYSNWTATSFVSILTGADFYERPFAPDDPWTSAVERYAGHFLRVLEAHGWETTFLGPSTSLCETGFFASCAQADALVPSNDASIVWPVLGGAWRFDGGHAALLDAALLRVAPSFLRFQWFGEGRFPVRRSLGWLAARDGDVRARAATERALQAFPHNLGLVRRVERSHRAFDHTIRALEVVDGPPRYFFVHALPPHRPFVLGPRCGVRAISEAEINERMGDHDPSRYRDQARCALGRFRALLDRLVALGIDPVTTVILQADTGLGVVADSGGALPPSWQRWTSTVEGKTITEIMAYAQPALLVRRAGARGAIRWIDRPTTHRQTFNSVLDLAGIPQRRDRPPSLWTGDAVRRVFALAERPVLPGMPFNGFQRFQIDGPVRDVTSWRDLGTWAAFDTMMSPPVPVASIELQVEPGVDSIVIRAVAPASAELMFVVRGLAADAQARQVQDWGPSTAIELTAIEVGCGLDVHVYARTVGSVAKYEAKAVVRLEAMDEGCPPSSAALGPGHPMSGARVGEPAQPIGGIPPRGGAATFRDDRVAALDQRPCVIAASGVEQDPSQDPVGFGQHPVIGELDTPLGAQAS